jgi:ABC-2 type transport system permease protein
MNWEQLKTILWLRWRLMRNQWGRNGGLGAVIHAIIGVFAIVGAVGSLMGGLLGAAFYLGDASPMVIMVIWAGITVVFLFFWLIGLLTELQRSETIDLQKLMHLPVALGQLFVVNYVVSHFTLSIIVMVPGMLGLAIGLAIARGPEMLLLVPLTLSMVVMITAWTYCLRGWLASMMSNPRRRRTIIMGITLSFVVLAQAPNLYFNVYARGSASRHSSTSDEDWKQQENSRKANDHAIIDQLIAAPRFIPPLWVAVGAQGLAEKNVLPASLGILGCLGIATLGLRRAYRGTLKFFLSDNGGKAVRSQPAAITPKSPQPPTKTGHRFLEWQLPMVPEQSAALALATFRSLARAPEVKMALGRSIISMLIFGSMIFLRHPPHLSDTTKPFAVTGVLVFAIFMLIQLFSNQFGMDRDGFRSLMLSPADRRLILLGKNLAVLPIGFAFGAVLLTLLSVWMHLPLWLVMAALFQLVTILLIASLGGNVLSILVPFRIQAGTMKPTKIPGLAMVTMLCCQLLFPIAMVPVFISPLLGWLWHRLDLSPLVPINLICSILLCGSMVFIYAKTLAPLGRLLHKREIKILGIVTVEVE